MRRVLEFRVASVLFGRLPRRLTYSVMTAVAWFVATLMPARLAGLRANVRQVLPDAPDHEINRIVRTNARNYAHFWVDLFRVPRMPVEKRDRLVSVEGEDGLREVLAAGRGCVVVAIHMGGWEGCAAFWGAHSEFETALIAEVLEPPALWRLMVQLRRRTGLQIIPLGRTAPRDIIRRLKENQVVAGAIDRDILGSGRPFDLFGAPASIPTGLFDVAQRLGSGIVPVVTLRDPGHRYRLIGFPPLWVGSGEGAVDDAVRDVLRTFEGVIRQHPDQWHVMVPIWELHAARVATLPMVTREASVG